VAIQRWDPVRDLIRIRETMNRLFEDALGRSAPPPAAAGAAPGDWQPSIDLFEERERYVLRADLPGVEPSDVQVCVEAGSLFVRGERRRDNGVAPETYLRVERPIGRFAAQVCLPPSVDPQRIHARHHNGVLEVWLHKRDEEPANRIDVTAGGA
jgi:HSP20 family protein